MSLSREFWVAIRQALLMVVDSLERELGICPRTAELRKRREPERSTQNGALHGA